MTSAAAMVLFALLQTQPSNADPQQVAALVREYESGIERRDASVHDRIFARDYSYTAGNGAFMNREEHMNFTRSGALAIESFKSEDQQVRMLGEAAAVVTGLWVTRDARGGGPPRDRRIRYILVFAKRDARWQIVAEQRTALNPERGLDRVPR